MSGIKGVRVDDTEFLLGDFTQEDIEGLVESLEADGIAYEVIPSDEPPPPPRPSSPSAPVGYTGEGRTRRGPRPTAEQLRRQEEAAAARAYEAHEAALEQQAAEEGLPKWAVGMREDLTSLED